MDFRPAVVNVDSIKQEGNVVVCNGCLTENRTLSPLNDKADLFMYLLGHQDTILDPGSILLCWECKAVLRKMQNFQYQVQYAQMVLRQMIFEKDLLPHKTLSNLNYCTLEKLDIKEQIEDYHRHEVIIDNNFAEIKIIDNTDIPITDDYKEEYIDDKKKIVAKKVKEEIEEFSDSYDNDFPDHNENSEQSDTDIKPERGLVKKEKKRLLFNKHATKTKNLDVDLSKYQSVFKEDMLTESEIENLGKYLKPNKKVKKVSLFCGKCRKQCDSAIDIKRHTTFSHILKSDEPGPYKCLECNETCPDKSSLRIHWNKHNMVKRCKLCRTTVPLHWNACLRQHAESHAFHWTCKICKDHRAVYRSFKDFAYHYRSLHRYSICHYCGNRSKNKNGVATHIRLKHLPPECKICNKQFKDNHCLRRHMSNTHPEVIDKKVKPELTYCVECDKQFPSQAKYRLHLKTTIAHNPLVAARKTIVPCPDCGKIFTRKSYMNNHYRLFHQKQTKHYCELCDKYLGSGWAMKVHIKGVHQKIREPKTKVCDICGRAFQTNAVLAKHRRTHTGERPYKCIHCPAAFAQSSALNSHTRTQHKA
ncbi:hypothetical protein O0L34_g10761 [Tuta absoluta]|nr:hypothetical protein O0L34_g10761 [Tuta absoluta]